MKRRRGGEEKRNGRKGMLCRISLPKEPGIAATRLQGSGKGLPPQGVLQGR
jgi:hypothetical protein